MYAGLWQRFGIPGDRAGSVDSRFIRYLDLLHTFEVATGGDGVDG